MSSYIATFVIGLLVGVLLGYAVMNNYWKVTAVKEGQAEYYLDSDYNRQWRWKP